MHRCICAIQFIKPTYIRQTAWISLVDLFGRHENVWGCTRQQEAYALVKFLFGFHAALVFGAEAEVGAETPVEAGCEDVHGKECEEEKRCYRWVSAITNCLRLLHGLIPSPLE